MERVNFELLWSLNGDWDAQKIESALNNYLGELTGYIELPPENKEVKVKIISAEYPTEIAPETIYSSWVERDYLEDVVTLSVYKECGEYLPFVLLRELYRCFLPTRVKDFVSVQFVVHYMVIEDASYVKKSYHSWKSFLDSNRQPLDNEQERIDKSFEKEFFHRELFKIFFNYIKDNHTTIQSEGEEFAALLFIPIQDNTYSFLSDPDNLEALRIFDIIYRSEKYYKTKKDYGIYFEEYKKAGKIDTHLTITSFLKSVEALELTVLAPSYRLSWGYFGASVIYTWVKFHPLVRKSAISRVLEKVEYIFHVRRDYASLSHDFFLGAFLPTVYLDDYLKFFAQLKNLGYVLHYRSLPVRSASLSSNSNYLRLFQSRDLFLNPNHPEYDEKYLFRNPRKMIHDEPLEGKFSLVDFILIDRLTNFSFSGRDVKQQSKQLKKYKEDLQQHKDRMLSLNSDLKKHFEDVINSSEIRNNFVDFVEKNKAHGFFYLLTLLNDIIYSFDTVEKSGENLQDNNNINHFQDLFDNNRAFLQLRTNRLYINGGLRKLVRDTIIPLYYRSKQKDGLISYRVSKGRYRKIRELLSSCLALQLFDLKKILKIVSDIRLYEKIYSVKEAKLNYYDRLEIDKITNETIDKSLEKLLALDPPRLIPSITRTLPYPYETVIYFIVRFSEENCIKVENLEHYFYMIEKVVGFDSELDDRISLYFIRSCYLAPRERYELTCILHAKFGKDLLTLKFPRGATYMPVQTLRKYYDFPNQKYFYTKEMFENYLLYARKMLQNDLNPVKEVLSNQWSYLLSNKYSMESLSVSLEKRNEIDKVECEETSLEQLISFVKNLDKNLSNPAYLKQVDKKKFFANHLKAIKFLPLFSKFGLSQYYLYFYPSDLDQINFRLLLNNSFQSLKCSVGVDSKSPSFLVKYLFPYKNPNARYFNRAAKQYSRAIREFCLFRLTRAYYNFHIDRPFAPKDWKIDPEKFEIYVQEVLFTDKWQESHFYLKECELDSTQGEVISPDSNEFDRLQTIYGRKAINLKEKMFVKHGVQFDNFRRLLRDGLVYPYVKLKGLELHEKIRFILPMVSKKNIKTVLNIFKFFNHCLAYEIEGRLYVQGQEKEITFDNGLYVKLYLPGHSTGSVKNVDAVGALINVLIDAFDILKIENYLILDAMVKPDHFLEHIFEDKEFLKDYNPLLNLRWSAKEKKYLNNKLFDKNNNPVYPDMCNGKTSEVDTVIE